jgi:hypothetical protein
VNLSRPEKIDRTTLVVKVNDLGAADDLGKKLKLNSVVLVRKRTIPTERPQPAGEVSANFS